jgi:hypothetical protein
MAAKPDSAIERNCAVEAKSRYRFGMNIPDHISEGIETKFFGVKNT